MEMVYGTYAYNARFIRADGTTVELKNGFGTMEHYKRVIPDYRYIGPAMLILLILSWGSAALVRAREENKPWCGTLAWMAVLVFSVFCLYWYWSAGAVLLF